MVTLNKDRSRMCAGFLLLNGNTHRILRLKLFTSQCFVVAVISLLDFFLFSENLEYT